MAQPSDIIRSGIRAEDLSALPSEMQQALEPLLRYVNTGIQGLAQALVRNVSLSDNVRNEVQTVNLDHGVAQLVSLKKLTQAKGVRSISVGSADGKTQQMLSQPLHLVGTTAPNQVKVLAYFTDSTAKRVPVTMELTPEGSYTSLSPGDPNPTSARYYRTSVSSLGSGAFAVVNFDVKDYDSDSAVTTGANWKYTVPSGRGAIYSVCCGLNLIVGAGAVNNFAGTIRRSGTEVARFGRIPVNANQVGGVSGATDIKCVAGDTIDVQAFQDSGGALNLEGAAQSTWISIRRVSQ